jgi:hypothetical protein
MKDWYWDDDVFSIDKDLAERLELENAEELDYMDNDFKYLKFGYTKQFVKETQGDEHGIEQESED